MNVLSPLDETVRDLTLAQHLPRIKKLLVYACTHQWESNAAELSSYHLHDLVQQLLQIAPTFSALKVHLNSVIQTLNKPAEYTLVANTIVRYLQHLYPDATSYSSDHYKSLYRIAVQHLEQDDDVNRIKKLIHFVCRNQWTHDLDAVDLSELIEELHALTPTPDELTAVLQSVVQTISKPDKYRAIAQRIIQGLVPLYHPAPHALPHSESAPSSSTNVNQALELPFQPSVPTQIQPTYQNIHQWEGQSPDTQPKAEVANRGSVIGSNVSEHSVAHRYLEPSQKPPKPISMRKKVASLSPEDLFELRNEIHKFTNPLLAKHLLFMNSYATAVKHDRDSAPGQWDVMVWDALKATDLDTLLCDGLKRCRNLGQFERSLKRTARQFKNSKQYSASISAIVRAVTPTFVDCQDSSEIVYPPIREESQGTPTYGKRPPLDGPPSKPLSQDPSDPPLAHASANCPPNPNTEHPQKTLFTAFAEQQTSVRDPSADANAIAKPKIAKVSNANTDIVGLKANGLEADNSEADNLEVDNLEADNLEADELEADELEPTESDSYLEDTETEWSSQADRSSQDNSESNSEDNEQMRLEQDLHLEQRLEQQLDAAPIAPHEHGNPKSKIQNPKSLHDHGGAEEETAYLVAPSLPPAGTSQQNQWSPESRPKANGEHPENSHQSGESVVDETLFLYAP